MNDFLTLAEGVHLWLLCFVAEGVRTTFELF